VTACLLLAPSRLPAYRLPLFLPTCYNSRLAEPSLTNTTTTSPLLGAGGKQTATGGRAMAYSMATLAEKRATSSFATWQRAPTRSGWRQTTRCGGSSNAYSAQAVAVALAATQRRGCLGLLNLLLLFRTGALGDSCYRFSPISLNTFVTAAPRPGGGGQRRQCAGGGANQLRRVIFCSRWRHLMASSRRRTYSTASCPISRSSRLNTDIFVLFTPRTLSGVSRTS